MIKRLFCAVAMLCAISAYAQRPALNSPVIRFQDNNGKPLAGGKLYSYQAGTTTPLATYTDSTTGAMNTNPVILDSTGSATVFLGNNVYKLVLQNAAGTVQWTADNIAQNAFNQGGGGSTGPAGGDLTGTYPNPLVNKIKGATIPVSQPCVGTNSSGQLIPCTTTAPFYQTLLSNGSALPQEPKFNLIPGTGTAISCVDNPTNTSTDCTFNLGSSTAVDYYWTEAGCVIGVGQPNHCDFTAHLPGAMPSASYQVFCTLNFLADTPAAACNLAQSTLPTGSGDSILMRIGQYQQDGTTGLTAPTIYMHAHYGSGGGGGGGGGGFPITLGTTVINPSSTTSALSGLIVNGVTLSASGSSSLFLDQTGAYSAPTGTGTVNNVATASPLGGGPITTSGTITCATCVTASAPGVGLAHFAGSTQAVTSSAVNLASADVTGLLPHANIASTAVTPGSYTNANITVAADGSVTGASNGSGGGATIAHTTNVIQGDGAGNGSDSGIGVTTCSGCHGFTVPASSSPVTPVSTKAIYTSDSAGNAAISENGAAASRPCTAANASGVSGCQGTGAVASVSNSDGTLTITPTTGAVVASIALGHANTWSGTQTFVAPALGAATATSLLASGNVDGTAPVTITTGTTATLGGTFKSGYTLNQEATAATAVAYTLPTAAAGLQYCVGNSWNGSAATTGVLTVNTSASGQFIIFTDGTLSATGGNVTSAGAAADFACFVGVDSTHWYFKPSSGTWTKH